MPGQDNADVSKALQKQGRAFYDAGNYEQALKTFEALRQYEPVEALLELAETYRAMADLQKAAASFNEALRLVEETGDPIGHLAIALAYQLGLPSVENSNADTMDAEYEAARDHFRKAAEAGVTAAQTLLAMELLLGLNGAKKNYAEYEHWITKAIEAGDEQALLEYANERMTSGKPLSDSTVNGLRKLEADWPLARKILKRLNLGRY